MSQKENYVQLNKEVTATKEGKAALFFTSSFGCIIAPKKKAG